MDLDDPKFLGLVAHEFGLIMTEYPGSDLVSFSKRKGEENQTFYNPAEKKIRLPHTYEESRVGLVSLKSKNKSLPAGTLFDPVRKEIIVPGSRWFDGGFVEAIAAAFLGQKEIPSELKNQIAEMVHRIAKQR